MRIIPSHAHSVIDYVVGGFLMALPVVFYSGAIVSVLVFSVGLGLVVYSFLSEYEPSVLRVIPMETHMILDIIVGGVIAVAAAASVSSGGPILAVVLAVVGALMVALALVSEGGLFTPRVRTSAMVLDLTEHKPVRLPSLHARRNGQAKPGDGAKKPSWRPERKQEAHLTRRG